MAHGNANKVRAAYYRGGHWDDPARSIEHCILRSSNNAHVDAIGVLTLLPPDVNSSLQDRPPEEKASRYVDCCMQATIAVGRTIRGKTKCNKEEVKSRAEQAEAFFWKEWGW